MPRTMNFEEQDNKWFSVLIFIGLPFIVFYKIIRNDLPYLKDIIKPPKF